MTVSVLSAAKRLGEMSVWTLSNLELQKMCYIAHMYYMGESDEHEPLVKGRFQAWDYGPVHPVLYQALKRFGADPVSSEAFSSAPNIPEGHRGIQYLDAAVRELPRGLELIAITHWEDGAWRELYEPGVMGIVISNDDILIEFKKRKNADTRTTTR